MCTIKGDLPVGFEIAKQTLELILSLDRLLRLWRRRGGDQEEEEEVVLLFYRRLAKSQKIEQEVRKSCPSISRRRRLESKLKMIVEE